MTQSGGHLEVSSDVGVGTRFRVFLPHSDRPVKSSRIPSQPPESMRGNETILLVEDQEAVRTIMRTMLRRNGYTVLEAENGGEAILICEQFDARIHLLLTDVVMPRMNGRQLATRLLSMRPYVKVLYMSGYAENTVLKNGVLDEGVAYLQKPITPDTLMRKVREVLDQGTVASDV